jgi:hypothetical protein
MNVKNAFLAAKEAAKEEVARLAKIASKFIENPIFWLGYVAASAS